MERTIQANLYMHSKVHLIHYCSAPSAISLPASCAAILQLQRPNGPMRPANIARIRIPRRETHPRHPWTAYTNFQARGWLTPKVARQLKSGCCVAMHFTLQQPRLTTTLVSAPDAAQMHRNIEVLHTRSSLQRRRLFWSMC
jgi:hypothetical protein